jgi:hypothetical protein
LPFITPDNPSAFYLQGQNKNSPGAAFLSFPRKVMISRPQHVAWRRLSVACKGCFLRTLIIFEEFFEDFKKRRSLWWITVSCIAAENLDVVWF